jgi:hypothetical protein
VRPSVSFRVVALLAALIASLVSPGLAVAHGLAHDHLAHEHGARHADHARDEDHGLAPVADHDDHDDDHHGPERAADRPAYSAPGHTHDHGHVVIDLARTGRDVGRVDVVPPHAPLPSAPAAWEVPRAHAPALVDHALLARPDPGSGPRPTLRAPPVR